ncbi:MAG: enoyl-CoA hydratase/isomerase family protein [Candidatus Marinimicrobia bacterium]|nr:enoyl-CoA hydratase/isomerase family protein [Candidatus Neomarinimicrobiota bacterium]
MNKIIKEENFDGQVIRITLNAPKANILDAEMMEELQSALDSFKSRPQIKLLQFTGTGNHFSFGASVAEHTKENAPQMLSQFHQLFFTLMDLAIPTAAIVSGQCLGGGSELALMCNFLFCDQSAYLGQPEILLGVFAPPASLILPMKIGQTRADEMLLSGKSINAETADKFGLVTHLYENSEALKSGVDAWVEKNILPKSASSLRFAVKAGRYQFNLTLRKHLNALATFYTTELMASKDANEGIMAFLEKRPPKWEY